MPVATLGSECSVNTATQANQTAPASAAFADGGFIVTWVTLDPAQDGDSQAIKAQRYAADGSTAGDEFLVTGAGAGYQFGPTVATFADGSFVIAWVTGDPGQDGSGNALKAQLFAGPTAVGGE